MPPDIDVLTTEAERAYEQFTDLHTLKDRTIREIFYFGFSYGWDRCAGRKNDS
jgi:hypothetical protein